MPCSCLYLSKDLKCLCLYFSSAMISKPVIAALYKKYSSPPEEISCLGLDEFVSLCGDLYSIELDNDSITFGQMSDDNPFRRILLRNIYGIEFFAYHIALVSSSYILFFNRDRVDVTVHFKTDKTFWLTRVYCWVRYRLFRWGNH